MKKIRISKLLFTAVWLAVFAFAAYPQQPVNLLLGQSTMTIKGTSSMHDWEEKVEKFAVNLTLKIKDKEVTGIDQVNFTCKSASIVSENSIMTNKTHDALQVEKYPDIIFKLISVDNLTSKGGVFSGTLSGDVTLAGVTKRVNISFTGNSTGNRIVIKGSEVMNMSDYKIKPPTAMLGTLKTGEQITLSFSLQFEVG